MNNTSEYVKVLETLDDSKTKPTKNKNKFNKITWKFKICFLKDNWQYSIKPMILNYNLFDFKIKTNEFGEKTTPWSRFKDLFLGVFYIVKSTFTYVPLGFK